MKVIKKIKCDCGDLQYDYNSLANIPTNLVTNEELENKGYLTEHQDISSLVTKDELTNKQDTLISGTNIKTINNQSILGDGNITIEGQWVAKQTLLVDGSVSAYLSMSPGQKRTFDLSDYLPKDDKLYEVMMSGSIQSGTAQGNHINVLVGSSYFGDINFCRCGMVSTSAIFTSGNAIIVVGNDRQIYVSASGGSNGVGQIDFLKLIGYREVR